MYLNNWGIYFSAVAEKIHDDGEEDGNVMKEHSDMEYMDNMGYEVKHISNHIVDAIATLCSANTSFKSVLG